jgi:1-phosphofructokinase
VIICVSANPAIDRRLLVPSLLLGQVNRATAAWPAPGGKAAHVAMAAKALGAEVLWVGFLGGTTGEECERGLAALGIPAVAIPTRSTTRVNIEVVETGGTVTEVLEPGGAVTKEEVAEMFRTCRRLFEQYGQGLQAVLSGSLPPGAGVFFYADLIRSARASGCGVLLDTSGEALTAGLAAAPDLVKPNREEASAAAGFEIRDVRTACEAARAFTERGARSVALSLGAEGLLWLPSPDSKPVFVRPPRVEGRSAVGCGDATLAGFGVGAQRGDGVINRAALAAACGAANCLADSPGMISADEVSRILPLVEVSEA